MTSIFSGPPVQSFQLTKAADPLLDPFGEDTKLAKVAQVVIDAANQTLSLDGKPLKHTYWNEGSNSVAWTCSESRIPEGHISFNNECNGLVGMVSYSSGEHIIVTGEPTEPPPEYESVSAATGPMLVDGEPTSEKVDEKWSFGPAIAPPVNFLAEPIYHGMMAAQTASFAANDTAKAEANEDIDVTVYTTKRLLVKDKNGNPVEDEEWAPFYNLSYGVQTNDDLSLVVYLDDDDISDYVDTEHGAQMTLFKSEGDPEKKERDYTFRIIIHPGVEDEERTFEGTYKDKKGEWEWKGKFFLDQKKKRVKTTGVEYGPDGKSTRTQLLMISSINSKGEDIAQKEGDRIFGKILLASIPDDAKKKLYPDAPTLDKDEEAIRVLGPDYLPRAAVVNLLQHLQSSDSVAPAQRNRINKTKLDAFFPACMAAEEPIGNQADPVQVFGWDRKKNKDEVDKVQQQTRAVALHCYRLGYIRAVTSFQPFLKDAAYWYKRLVEYIESPIHLRQFTHRVKSQDDRIERDVYDWHTKLELLHNVCGDQEGVSSIEEVMNSLKGASTLATLDTVEWNDDFRAHLKEFFEKLDEVHNDPLKSKDEEYAKLQKLMAERGAATWSELGKSIISLIDAHVNFLHRKPTVTELSTIIARKEAADGLKGFWPNALVKVKAAIRPAIIMGGMFVLTNALMGDTSNLSLPEKISMYASLVQGVLMQPGMVVGPIQFVATSIKYLAKGVGWCLKKLLPTRSLSFINAAKWFGTKVEQLSMAIKGLWKTFSKGVKLVFGFFVSCICVWAAADEFVHAMKHGRTVDKWFAGVELLITAAGCITLAVQIGAALWGTEGAMAVVAFCGTLGMVLMAIGLVIAIVAFFVTQALKEDPVKDFIDKYGGQYGLLK